jgi:hypothetical protein
LGATELKSTSDKEWAQKYARLLFAFVYSLFVYVESGMEEEG